MLRKVILQHQPCTCLFASSRSLHSAQATSAKVLHYARLSSTPAWNERSLAAVREKYEQKYAERLQQKAKEQGLSDVNELKQKSIQEGRLKNRVKDILARSPPKSKPAAPAQTSQSTTSSTSKPSSSSSASSKSPIKPLNDIVDLEKLLPQSADAIGQIWNAYHQMKPNTLSAVIPGETYLKMTEIGKQYPQFVVPLPRQVKDDQGVDREGAEIHFMQWAFLPPLSEGSPVPGPSTVLFTPLALYQSQQTFAQPHLILTHYPDLLPSHGIVLMRGDLSDSVSTSIQDGQLLVLRLQQFYQNAHKGRAELLKTFHETPEKFEVQKLVDSIGEI